MEHKNDPYGLENATDVPAESEDYSLEEILAEFGGSLEQTLLRGTEMEPEPEEPPAELTDEIPPPPQPVPGRARPLPPESGAAPARPPAAEKTATKKAVTEKTPAKAPPAEEAPAPAEDPEAEERISLEDILADPDLHQPAAPTAELDILDMALPKAPRPVPLEDMVGSTVSAVMEETAEEPLLPPRRRGLFSRKPLEDTERIPPPPEPESEPDPEPIGPEPELFRAAASCRTDFHRRRRMLPAAAIVALLPTLLLVLERLGIAVPGWSGDAAGQTYLLLACLAVTALLCRHVFIKGVRLLLRGRCTGELLIALSALVSAADCVCRLLENQRTDTLPYASVSCLGLVFALWACARESGGMYDTFRSASLDDDPPYLVTETPQGACKQRGAVPGFYTAAMRDNGATLWQTVFLPLVLAATVVFAGLSSLGQQRGDDFLLNWSAILAAGATFALPLGWGLAYGNLARHLQKAGCAVAGWSGAERISRRKKMILTDADLFPPGTIHLGGVKVFGEELTVAVSHGASMARAAGSGLERLFDELLRTELGAYEEVSDFAFYEEGGWSGVIRGESILMGTASFMRKMDVRLPGDINLKTGLFLSVDRHLIAAFAVKYEASENVDFALRMMARSHVSPILASRDPNIVPELLRRKFHKGVKVEFPSLTTRVALSEAEKDRGLPRALIFREGLLPYAETVVGSRRMCRAVRRAAFLSLLGSAAGTLLAFYLLFLRQYALLTPLALELFLLLWTLPVLLMVDWAKRY